MSDKIKCCKIHEVFFADPCDICRLTANLATRDQEVSDLIFERSRLRDALEKISQFKPFGIIPVGDINETIIPWKVAEEALASPPKEEKLKESISYDYGSTWPKSCPVCGGTLEVVRPGKVQCVKCG